jgi:SAM-dependent methyltransferase
MSNKVNFGKVANDYARYRDPLPEVIFEQFKQRNINFSGKKIVDLGSGSGIFCRALVSQGGTVIGIEPETNLIDEAIVQDNLQGCSIQYINTKAEEISLPNHCFDVITVLRAWHWFERDKVIKEVTRLLNNHGYLIVIHSIFVPHLSEEVQQTMKIIKESGVDMKPAGSMADSTERRSGFPINWFKEWEENGLHLIDEWQYNYELPFLIDEWCGKVRSLSWMTNVDKELKQNIIKRIKASLNNNKALIIPHQYSVVILKV